MKRYASEDEVPHGLYRYGTHGCRCEVCSAHHRRAFIKWRLGYRSRVNAAGTIRRLQAMRLNGWSSTDMANECNLSVSMINLFSAERYKTIHYTHARSVAEMYDKFWNVARHNVRAIKHAKQNGYLPAGAWFKDGSEVIDDPKAEPSRASIHPDFVSTQAKEAKNA